MAKKKYYYAIVKTENGELLIEDSKLPIYWNKEVAAKVVKKYEGYCITPVNIKDFEKFILTHPF